SLGLSSLGLSSLGLSSLGLRLSWRRRDRQR
ncbi:MAG: hypothetical protein JW818_07385, partial [Pirellulales bacterium]|nr:hypothetical protein [Pirellulales bacterium]